MLTSGKDEEMQFGQMGKANGALGVRRCHPLLLYSFHLPPSTLQPLLENGTNSACYSPSTVFSPLLSGFECSKSGSLNACGWAAVAQSLEAETHIHILAATVFIVTLSSSLTFSKHSFLICVLTTEFSYSMMMRINLQGPYEVSLGI